jgi:5-formyltetrahydrofolate cyclo-ligase
MASQTPESKRALRLQVRAQLRGMTAVQRSAASMQACALLEQQEAWRQARSILFYAPLPQELDVWPLLRESLDAGKTVALPRYDSAARHYIACRVQEASSDIRAGQFGIREPAAHCPALELGLVELVLVPGLAFDAAGRRLGRGKGFYDKLLGQVRGATCGVAFDEQLVSEVPTESHDVVLNYVLTPTRWIEP